MWSSHSVPAGRVPPPVLKSECLNCSVHLCPIHHSLPSFRFTSSKQIKELKMHQEFVVVFSLVCYTDTSAQLWQIWFYYLQKKSKRGPVREKDQTDFCKVDRFYFTKNTSPLPFHLQPLELSLSDSCPPTVQAALPSLPEHSC